MRFFYIPALMILSATTASAQQLIEMVPPELTGAGPAGNPAQARALERIHAQGEKIKDCKLLVSENVDSPLENVYAAYNEEQVQVLMEMFEDMFMTDWRVMPLNGDAHFPLAPGLIAPDTFVKGLQTDLFRRLPTKNDWEKNLMDGYYVFPTACGKFLLKIEKVPYQCNGTDELIGETTGEERVLERPFRKYWSAIDHYRRWNYHPAGRDFKGVIISSETVDNKSLYVVRPERIYASTYSNAMITDEFVIKSDASNAEMTADILETGLLLTEVLPFGTLVKTLVAKGYYQYETMYGAAHKAEFYSSVANSNSKTAIAVDTAFDVIPFVGQYAEVRKASKLFWASAAASSTVLAKKIGGHVVKPAVVAMRSAIMAAIAFPLRSLSRAEIVDDMSKSFALAANMRAATGKALPELSHKAKQIVNHTRQFVASLPRSDTYDDVLKFLHISSNGRIAAKLASRISFHHLWDTEMRLLALGGELKKKFIDPMKFLTPSNSFSVVEQLTKMGLKIVHREDNVGLFNLSKLLDEVPARAQELGIDESAAFRDLVQEFIMKAGTSNQYDSKAKTVILHHLQLSGKFEDYSFNATQRAIIFEEMNLYHIKTFKEEVYHATGFLYENGIGFHTLDTIRNSDELLRYVPQTVSGFNFQRWLAQAPEEQLKKLLSGEQLEKALRAVELSGFPDLRSFLMGTMLEADIFFHLQESGFKMHRLSRDHNYPVRALAARWYLELGKP